MELLWKQKKVHHCQIQAETQANNRQKQCYEYNPENGKVKTNHCRMGELLCHCGYGQNCQNIGYVAKKKDTDVLLETVEKNQNKTR